jgi:hypothetical protein
VLRDSSVLRHAEPAKIAKGAFAKWLAQCLAVHDP